jgi:hypothetical protein
VLSSIAVWVRPTSWAGVSKIEKNGRRFSKLTRDRFPRDIIFIQPVQIAVSGIMPDHVVVEHLGKTRTNYST